jgi:hypothetical protein
MQAGVAIAFDDLLGAGYGNVELSGNLAQGVACLEAGEDGCVAFCFRAMRALQVAFRITMTRVKAGQDVLHSIV